MNKIKTPKEQTVQMNETTNIFGYMVTAASSYNYTMYLALVKPKAKEDSLEYAWRADPFDAYIFTDAVLAHTTAKTLNTEGEVNVLGLQNPRVVELIGRYV